MYDIANIESVWRQMKHRANAWTYDDRFKSYYGCSYSEEWEEYNNFRDWYLSHMYNTYGEGLCLDKDLLIKGNRVYSPSTCCLIPHRINTSISTRRKGKNGLPPGVTRNPYNYNQYLVSVSFDGISIRGKFDNKEDAFKFYKDQKEKNIKALAKYYIDILPEYIYDALLRYSISIDDSRRPI